jgi:hypothetical protein
MGQTRATARSHTELEIVMNRISAIRRLAVMLAGLTGALLASTAVSPAAFAVRVPPPGGYDGTVQAPPEVHTIVIGGMPGWQITVIAIAAALLGAVLAVLAHRIHTARRRVGAGIA